MTPVPGARVLALLALLPTFGLAQACPRATQASAFDTLVEEGWSCIQFRDWTRLISIGKRVAASSPNRTEGHFFLTYGYAEDGQLPKARESLSALNRTGALPHELVGLNGGPLRSDPVLAQVVGDAQSRADWLQKAMFQPIVPSAPGHGVRSSAEMRRSVDSQYLWTPVSQKHSPPGSPSSRDDLSVPDLTSSCPGS